MPTDETYTVEDLRAAWHAAWDETGEGHNAEWIRSDLGPMREFVDGDFDRWLAQR